MTKQVDLSDPGLGRPGPAIEAELARAGLPPIPRLAWLEVDLATLERNARAIAASLDPGTRLGVVVKADGYGHGIEASARAALAGGADSLLVATADEGLGLRAHSVGAARIVVLYPVPGVILDDCRNATIEVTVADEDSLAAVLAWARRARRSGPTPSLRVHLAVDSGMARGGVRPDQAGEFVHRLAQAPGLELAGVWSHLATPEDQDAVRRQVARFELAIGAIRTGAVRVPVRHLAASGGLLGGLAPQYDLVRAGLLFYGELPPGVVVHPTKRALAAALRPGLTLKARPASIQALTAGASVGYGGDWRAARASIVVTLPIGYADGWVRAYAPGARVLLRGLSLPIVGRISSDSLAVDATAAGPISPDDNFVLLGSDGPAEIRVDELARLRGSISWEVLDAFSARLARVYRSDGMLAGVRYPDGRTVWLPAGEGMRPRTALTR